MYPLYFASWFIGCWVFVPDFPENAIKGIVKHLLLTLWRYQDGKSRRAVDAIFAILASKYLQPTAKILPGMLSDFAELQKKISIRY